MKYSDHYVNGQKITQDALDYIYTRELHDCSSINRYMGLWQLAQAANALDTPIQSVFPEGGDNLMRLDFNRMFFPINYQADTHREPIIIMWTSFKAGWVPNHFVPLLPKRPKYGLNRYLNITVEMF